MKLTKPSIKRVENANLDHVKRAAKDLVGITRYVPLLMLIADMFDGISDGEDLYMMIGATKNRDSFSLTVKQDGQPTTVYAVNLVDLATQADTLL
jgi:hypothetical protein